MRHFFNCNEAFANAKFNALTGNQKICIEQIYDKIEKMAPYETITIFLNDESYPDAHYVMLFFKMLGFSVNWRQTDLGAKGKEIFISFGTLNDYF